MPTWVSMTVLLAWLACPVVYTIAIGKHYTRLCQAELAAVRSYVDEVYAVYDELVGPGLPTEPIPVVTPGRHRQPD